MSRDLNTRLLSDVSRSFYLSLRFLPQEFRFPLSTAYLLARATDTVADTANSPGERRGELLEEMRTGLVTGNNEALCRSLQEELAPTQKHQGECELLNRYEEVLAQYDLLSSEERKLVQVVLDKIIRGQKLDLERFDYSESQGAVLYKDGVYSLASKDDLMEYTYLVAGCVGEFWTDLGFLIYGDNYASESPETMREKGRTYGQALQLINILRDIKEDESRGRRYIPEEIGDPDSLWTQAYMWLMDGLEYTEAVYGKRLRFATGLPILIGIETLFLLRGKIGGDKVKVPRKKIYLLLWQAIILSRKQGGWLALKERAMTLV